MKEKIDMTNLEKAIKNATSNIHKLSSETRKNLDDFDKAAFRQIYEDLYETTRKTLFRFISMKINEGQYDDIENFGEIDFFDKIRVARKKKLTSIDIENWDRFRNLRNISSHGYEENRVDEVLNGLPFLLKEAIFIHQEIENRK